MLSIGQRLLATRCLAAALQMTVRRARAGNSKAGSMTCLSWPRSGGTVPRRNALRIGTRRQMATGAPVLRPADGAAVRSEGVEASGRDRRHRPADPQPAVRAGANLDRARPPGEPALVDQQGLPGRAHAVVQQVASSWAGRAAGRDILHPAGVVPGTALRAVRVKHIDELRSARVKKPLEVGRAVGLDPDAGMLAEGCRAAEEKRVMNIRWVQGLAEDLPAVAPGPYRLVTFGQSFHWTDEQRVAETVYGMLEPGGALALIVHTVTGRPRPPDSGVPAIPHDEIKALVQKYLGSTRRAGQGTAPERTHRFEDVLARTRFGVPQQFFVPGIPDLLRDSESVLSGYFSLSSSAPHLFGDRLDDFAGEVRALLANRSAEGIFWDWPGDTEVVMARKPG